MASKLEIEYLDYCFTATLEIGESGRTRVVDWHLASGSRSQALAWGAFDRFLERHDFADEEDARANIVDWLEQLADPRSGASAGIAKAGAAASGAVSTDGSTAEGVSETVLDIVADLDWIEAIADWLSN
ncbi:hypothetical protein GQ57_15410 [Burkholderia sp. MSh2]|uniref:Uncharacterized protein n=1 Tax=Burkholderia paludis TaxID=1506587 RepID=A0A6P2IB84_9BURK|nr:MULTISPECIES: hypothetical protein [Burkholderia]KEZ04944.1 hypothetical protein GQ57_15410 [Burkholderia sp. MSh2]KFG97265.1 hypothetical protein GQ56_0110475 [Burkholderia paludis]CAB3746836.1 hypothetical protein LMG30113_00294 [Burkholderia paludis]VWB26811.1 hypothetical protein BPA30113_00979 [Burkholderia paludis]